MKITGRPRCTRPVERCTRRSTTRRCWCGRSPAASGWSRPAPDTYQATVTAGVASIKGTFDGEVRLTDQRPPTLHAARLRGRRPGHGERESPVTLAAGRRRHHRLTYDADAVVGGVIGGVGQRMLAGVAKRPPASSSPPSTRSSPARRRSRRGLRGSARAATPSGGPAAPARPGRACTRARAPPRAPGSRAGSSPPGVVLGRGRGAARRPGRRLPGPPRPGALSRMRAFTAAAVQVAPVPGR